MHLKGKVHRNQPSAELSWMETTNVCIPPLPLPLIPIWAPLFLTPWLVTCHPQSRGHRGDSASLLFQPVRQWVPASCCGGTVAEPCKPQHIVHPSLPFLELSLCRTQRRLFCAEQDAMFPERKSKWVKSAECLPWVMRNGKNAVHS